MKIMQLSTAHPDYLRLLHKKNRNAITHKQCIDSFLRDYYWAGHILTPELEKLGHETFLTIPVDTHSQAVWCREAGIATRPDPSFALEVIAYQISLFQPDVLYVTIPQIIDDKILTLLPKRPRLIIGWNASLAPHNTSWTEYDIMLSSHPFCIDVSLKLGAKRYEYFYPGFPEEVIKNYYSKLYYNDVVFSGYWTGTHVYRNNILRKLLLDLKHTKYNLAYYLAFMPDAPEYPPEILAINRGSIWGKAMFRAFSASKIVLNAYTDLDNGPQNISPNMRQMEATGSGALLMTQASPNLAAFFEPGKEVETFADYNELKEKTLFYLNHEKERHDIAHAGQQACIARYNLRLRAEAFINCINRHLRIGVIPNDRLIRILQTSDVHAIPFEIQQKIIELAAHGPDDARESILPYCQHLDPNRFMGMNFAYAKQRLAEGDTATAMGLLKAELAFWPQNDPARELLSKLYCLPQ
ncbi:glycosyltransferase [uncultured Desulfovibrio sp.]|uniref:glycosyltransferase family protein n=1 Tax=uncultured Desulfovibrio sp. TaxID=167968 RepID=UPI00262C5782|nr:glycosyltransferase [uncultured Desulfovibrio sp.]